MNTQSAVRRLGRIIGRLSFGHRITGAACWTVGFSKRGIRKAGCDPVPNPATYEIKAVPARPARRHRVHGGRFVASHPSAGHLTRTG
jgi:hypothetical protein